MNNEVWLVTEYLINGEEVEHRVAGVYSARDIALAELGERTKDHPQLTFDIHDCPSGEFVQLTSEDGSVLYVASMWIVRNKPSREAQHGRTE